MSGSVPPQPEVSVIITVFNEPELVGRAVASVLAQTGVDFEVVIVDDGSTDSTWEALRQFDDGRIRLHKRERVGRAAALAFAAEASRGEFIANLDADDEALPGRLAKQAKFLAENSAYAWVGCAEERVDTQRGEHLVRRYPTADETIRRQCAKCIPYSHSGIMFRRSLLDEGLNYDPNQKYLIDFEFFLRVASRHKTANLEEVLARRYVRDESFFQSNYRRAEQNRRLAEFGWKAVRDFKLPVYHAIFPLARLVYPWLPNGIKRLVRRRNGLGEGEA